MGEAQGGNLDLGGGESCKVSPSRLAAAITACTQAGQDEQERPTEDDWHRVVWPSVGKTQRSIVPWR
jgi:hypothetical protein